MPHQPSTANGKSVDDKVMFCSVSLTKERRLELKQWAGDCSEEDVLSHLNDAAMDGYRISIKSEDTGYSASLSSTGRSGSKVNNGKILMERASTVERALKRLIWAHKEVYERKWVGGAIIDDDW